MIDWTFDGTWPYEPRWFNSADGRMHYVDAGEGRPVVMFHGNPTWGYLYREFIEAVTAAGYRAIVPDLLGFGRSDKPDDPRLYTISQHAGRLDALLESLDLNDATAVVQDWGGPLGLSWATRHPERVRSLFILNTFAHRPPGKVKLPFVLKLFRTPGVGEVLVKGLHFFVRGFMFQAGINHKERITTTMRNAYLQPNSSWSARTPILVFPREIPADATGVVSDFLANVEQGLAANFREKPVAMAWPMKDPAFTPNMVDGLWLKTLPHAEVTRIEDASHYIQEDAPEQVVPLLLDLLER